MFQKNAELGDNVDPATSAGTGEVVRKLGILRLYEVYFAVSVIYYLLNLSFISFNANDMDTITTPLLGNSDEYLSKEIHLSLSSYFNYLWLISYSAVLWLIIYRKKIAKLVIIVLFAINLTQAIGESLIEYFTGNAYISTESLPIFILTLSLVPALYILAIFYLCLSKKVPGRLNHSLFEPDAVLPEFRQPKIGLKFTRRVFGHLRKVSNWQNIVILFILFSFLGHIAEYVFCLFLKAVGGAYDPDAKLWYNLFDPYLVYGFGILIGVFAIYPIRQAVRPHFCHGFVPLLITIVSGAFLCSVVEFIEGMLVNSDYQYWDYRELPFNIMGQVCLQNAVAFGVVVTVVATVIYPMLNGYMNRMPRVFLNLLFIICMVSFLSAMFFYEIKL